MFDDKQGIDVFSITVYILQNQFSFQLDVIPKLSIAINQKPVEFIVFKRTECRLAVYKLIQVYVETIYSTHLFP